MTFSDLKITIENPKSSYKSFADKKSVYPLKGVEYPTDYGCIDGYIGEDGDDLDVFVGSGELFGSIKVWRLDIPEETKFLANVSQEEFNSIITAFKVVIVDYKIFDHSTFINEITKFKSV